MTTDRNLGAKYCSCNGPRERHCLRSIFSAFTIIELLTAMAIMSVILVVIFGITQQTSNAWRSTNSKIEAFQGARAAFETVTQNLGQATLSTYFDYFNAQGQRRTLANSASFVPASYGRYSDLHFISGKSLISPQISHAIFFQTPAGYSDSSSYADMNALLNACGYYIVFDKDPARPPFLNSLPNRPPDRYRYRLMQFLQPSQALATYAASSGNAWFTDSLASPSPPIQQIAENIIALILLPKAATDTTGSSLAPNYDYDSRSGSGLPQPVTQNQLPPLIDVTMVAIDESSAKRLAQGSTAPDFGVAGLFSQADNFDRDLQTLEATLASRRIAYRVFRTTVALRGAKFSS